MNYVQEHKYRSASCRAMAERLANPTATDSLNIKVNIDAILPNRDHADLNNILLAIQENRSFVLYSDKKNYCIIIPRNLVVCCYADGVKQTVEVMKDMQQFQNRVKIALAVYDKFHPIDRCVEDRTDGDGALPEAGDRKQVQDGTGYEKPGTAELPEQVVQSV
jgi:hypothetical protein